MLLQVFLGMALSFVVFPGVLLAKPISFIDDTDWTELTIIGLFNTFDTLGRFLGGFGPLMIDIKRRFWLNLLALSRIFIVVLVILVAVGIFSD